MKTWGSALAVVALVLGGLVLVSPAASADTPGCVSRAENRRVDRGMTKRRVHRIVDTHGRAWDGHAGGYTRRYNPCWTSKFLYWTYRAPFRRPHRLIERQLGLG
jgi:hypothetical protein